MFIDSSTFKKLVKGAYKGGGLTLCRKDGWYLIAGNYWALKVAVDSLSNKEKASIVELVGDMPEEGQTFKAMKDGDTQWMIDMPEWTTHIECGAMEDFYEKTCVILENFAQNRLLQSTTTGAITAVNEIFIHLVDRYAMTEQESEPEGPYTVAGCDFAVFWANESCKLMACICKPEEDEKLREIIRALERVNMLKEVK